MRSQRPSAGGLIAGQQSGHIQVKLPGVKDGEAAYPEGATEAEHLTSTPKLYGFTMHTHKCENQPLVAREGKVGRSIADNSACWLRPSWFC
jgi:hypothetical protein